MIIHTAGYGKELNNSRLKKKYENLLIGCTLMRLLEKRILKNDGKYFFTKLLSLLKIS